MATYIMAIVLMGIVLILLAVTILFKKNGKFPDTHIEDNPHLKKYGITCASHDEYECACSSTPQKSGCDSCSLTSCSLQDL